MILRKTVCRVGLIVASTLTVGLAPCLGASAQTTSPQGGSPQRPPAVTVMTLKNGLTVLLEEDHAAPVVTWTVLYRLGSRNEAVGEAGAAHLLERLTFEGTDRFGKGQIAQLLDRNGAAFDARTTEDYTSYRETYSADRLQLGLQIEADRMRHVSFNEPQRAAAVATVLRELDRRAHDPREALDDAVRESAYVSHPYHHPVLGYASDVQGVSTQELRRLYNTYYRPNNAVAVLVGDFQTAQAAALLHQDFDAIPRGPVPPSPDGAEQPQQGQRHVVLDGPGAGNVVELAFHVPAATSPQTPTLGVIAALLADGSSGLLDRDLVERGLATRVWAKTDELAAPGLFRIGAVGSASTDHRSLTTALETALHRLMATPVSDAVLQRARTDEIVRHAFHDQGTSGIAGFLGRWAVEGIGDEGYQLQGERAAVTAQDVQQVAKATFDADNRTVGWYVGPGQGRSQGLDQVGATPAGTAGNPVVPALASAAVRRFPTQPFELDPARVSPASGIHTFTLANGLELTVVENPLDSTVAVDGFVRAGAILDKADPSGHYGTAALTAALLGTRGVSFRAGLDRTSFWAKGLSAEVSVLLSQVTGDLMNSSFSPIDLRQAKQRARDAIGLRGDSPRAQADRLLWATLYPTGHPLSPPAPPAMIADLSAITPADLTAFHQRFYGPNDTGIVVAGNVDAAQIEASLQSLTASWHPVDDLDPARLPGWDIRSLSESAPVVDPILDRTEVAIRLGEVVPLRRADPDFASARVMNAILGQGPASRLGITLKAVMHLAREVSSGFQAGRLPGPWVVRASVNRAHVKPALIALHQVLTDYLAYGPTDDELTDARSRLIGSRAVELSTNSGIARILADALYYDNPAAPTDPFDPRTYFATFDQDTMAVTRDRVVDAARRLLHPEATTIAIAGPYSSAGSP